MQAAEGVSVVNTIQILLRMQAFDEHPKIFNGFE